MGCHKSAIWGGADRVRVRQEQAGEPGTVVVNAGLGRLRGGPLATARDHGEPSEAGRRLAVCSTAPGASRGVSPWIRGAP